MVPGSTLMYGSSLISVTSSLRDSSSAPSEAADIPLPNEETTPPVMKMYLVMSYLDAVRDRRWVQVVKQEQRRRRRDLPDLPGIRRRARPIAAAGGRACSLPE